MNRYLNVFSKRCQKAGKLYKTNSNQVMAFWNKEKYQDVFDKIFETFKKWRPQGIGKLRNKNHPKTRKI